MPKKIIGPQRVGENRVGSEVGPDRSRSLSEVAAGWPPRHVGALAPVAKRVPKSLMKTSDLAPKGNTVRRSEAGPPPLAAAVKARPRKPAALDGAVNRKEKIEERIAAASEELASGI